MKNAEAQRKFRREHPDYVKRQKALAKCREDARRMVAEVHRDVYVKIYAKLRKERGLDK